MMTSHAPSTDHHDDHHGGDGHDFAHPMPLWILFAVFFALVILTLITVAQSNFEFGTFDVAIVMVIATVKAMLVALFFMHLAFDKPLNLLVFTSAFVFVGLFVIFTLGDNRQNTDQFEPVVDQAVVVGTH